MPDWLFQGIVISLFTILATSTFTYLKDIYIKFFKSKFYQQKLHKFYIYLVGFICSYTLILVDGLSNTILIIINVICTIVNLIGVCSTYYENVNKEK